MVDIHAEIVPGKEAAGFKLGQRIEDVMSSIHHVSEWTPSSAKSLSETIRSTPGWLTVSVSHLSNGARSGENLYYGEGVVELHFNAKGVLFDISVFDGYSGTLWGSVKVGDPLSLVQDQCGLEYDDGDEMHYPSNSAVGGVAFYAEERSLEESLDQVITGISIHDWNL